MRFFLPFSLLAISLTSCASQAPTTPQATTATSAQAATATPVIIFRKTPCFGTCPHYEVSIYADGRVAYEGFKYAPVEGKRELKMPVATINTILAEAKAVGFTGLQETYSAGVSDLPSTVLTLNSAGTTKTVTVEGNAPVELQNLFKFVQKQVEESLGASADR